VTRINWHRDAGTGEQRSACGRFTLRPVCLAQKWWGYRAQKRRGRRVTPPPPRCLPASPTPSSLSRARHRLPEAAAEVEAK